MRDPSRCTALLMLTFLLASACASPPGRQSESSRCQEAAMRTERIDGVEVTVRDDAGNPVGVRLEERVFRFVDASEYHRCMHFAGWGEDLESDPILEEALRVQECLRKAMRIAESADPDSVQSGSAITIDASAYEECTDGSAE